MHMAYLQLIHYSTEPLDKKKLFGEKKEDTFPRFVPNVLWATKRGRPDNETAVSLLMKRLSEPRRDD